MYDRQSPSSQAGGPPAWMPHAAMISTVCANCHNTLRSGAKFCTRCGVAIGVDTPIHAAPVSQQHVWRKPSSVKLAKKSRGWHVLVFLPLFFLFLFAMALFSKISDRPTIMPASTAPPYDLTAELSGGGRPLPTLPDPQSSSNSALSDFSLQNAWIEPGVMDPAGYLGFRIDALVTVRNSSDVRFGVHLRSRRTMPVLSNDARFSDANGQFCAVADVIQSQAPTKVSVFVPLSAVEIRRGENQMQLLPALFDSDNNPLFAGKPVDIVLKRDNVEITRARMVKPGAAEWLREIHLDISATPGTRSSYGQIVVRFLDADERMIAAAPPMSNAAGEMMISQDLRIPQPPSFTLRDVTITLPGALPSRAVKADVRLFDPKTQAWSSSDVRLPIQ